MATKLIIVGGFLGAGKTTLLWRAANSLAARGKKVGLITNDQAPDLVDTAFLSRGGARVREVSGSCFCCNFEGFLDAVGCLMDQRADIIIAEPVGSCTDLSATIMQPLKDLRPEIDLAPLTVLVAPNRVREMMRVKDSIMHDSALYILRLQMEEADYILLNKIDTLSAGERDMMVEFLWEMFPNAPAGEISTRENQGVDAWLDAVLLDDKAGKRIVDVDYDRYAEGEAVFGWLNAVAVLESATKKTDWRQYARDLMEHLHGEFKQLNAEIGHVKLMIESNGEECMANLTHLRGEIETRGAESIVADNAELILNARVQMAPEQLEKIVKEVLVSPDLPGISATIRKIRCLMPGRPNPTHRYSHIV